MCRLAAPCQGVFSGHDDKYNCHVKKAKGKSPSVDVPPHVPPHVPQGEEDASDAAAFRLEMADVVPLGPDPRRRVRHAPRISAPAAPTPPDIHDDGGDDAFAAPGVDRKEIRKLKRGEYAAGDRYDLHGMTAADACASVERFIDSSRHSRHRCVCIVHGRGLHSEGIPILRARVRKYLRSHRSVLAYADAPRSDGGAGAVYVLLRKVTAVMA